MKKIFFLIIITLCYIACGGPEKERISIPDWISNPNAKYNEKFYLTAVGSGDTKRSAEKNAYANVSKIIKAKVTSDESLNQQYTEKSGQDLSSNEEINKFTRIQTEQTLKNIKIAETFLDPRDKTYYVLAYLDRVETAGIYEEEINNNINKIYNYYQNYHRTTDKLQKLKFLQKAIRISENTEELNNQLRVIDPTGQGVDLKIDTDKLQSERMKFAKTVSINISSKGKYKEILNDYLADVFNDFGFAVYTGKKSADFLVEGELSIEKINLQRKGLEFVGWNLKIDIKEQVSEKTEISFTRNGRSGHVNLERAKSRALNDVKEVIQNQFYDFFISQF